MGLYSGGLIFGGWGPYLWNEVSVGTCGGLIMGGLIFGGLIIGGLRICHGAISYIMRIKINLNYHLSYQLCTILGISVVFFRQLNNLQNPENF